MRGRRVERVKRPRPTLYVGKGRCRRVRVIVSQRDRALIFQGRAPVLLVLLVLLAATLSTAVITGYLRIGSAIGGALVLAWLAYGLRVMRLTPDGPRGDGPAPPGGAGVREPRRPRPHSPAGAAARPYDDEEPPGRAVAVA